MSDADNQFDPQFAKIYSDVLDRIGKHGYTTVGVFPTIDEPEESPFVYTIGCAVHGGFEYCIAGLSAENSSNILHSVYEKLLSGWRPTDNEKYDHFANMPIKFKLMFGNHEANMSRWYWKRAEAPFFVMQLIWPDTNGVFPGEESFEEKFLLPQMIQGSPLSINWS